MVCAVESTIPSCSPSPDPTGVRGGAGTPDRRHAAASQLRVDDVDWDHLFGDLGVRWLHNGGIYAALLQTKPDPSRLP